MAENSAISWTDHTFNPWWGCTKVGPGCDHCYAETFDKRVGGDHWGAGKPRREVKDWSKPRKWNREAERTGISPWVFCASMADVFDNEVPVEWRERLWQLVRETPRLRWIFVTKRIGNAAKMLPPDWRSTFGHCGLCATIVNQEEANRDIPKLLATPAAWRGVSAEPLLGPIDFNHIARRDPKPPHNTWAESVLYGCVTPWMTGQTWDEIAGAMPRLDWIIVGGESGSHARPMHPRWAVDIRDQCAAAGISFHFKQFGEWLPLCQAGFSGAGWQRTSRRNGKTYGRVTSGHFGDARPEFGGREIETKYPWLDQDRPCHYLSMPAMLRVGKAVSGRLLDGVEHNGMPPSLMPSVETAGGMTLPAKPHHPALSVASRIKNGRLL